MTHDDFVRFLARHLTALEMVRNKAQQLVDTHRSDMDVCHAEVDELVAALNACEPQCFGPPAESGRTALGSTLFKS